MAPSMTCMVKARRAHSRPQYLSRWRPEEDSILLDHVMEHGTTQWGLLQRSGLLPGRDNKACCNRFILLRRKFMRQKRFRGSAVLAAEAEAAEIPDPADSHGSTGSGSGGRGGSSQSTTAPPVLQDSSSPLRPPLQLQLPRSASFPSVQSALPQPSPRNEGATGMQPNLGPMSAGVHSTQIGMLQWSPLPTACYPATMADSSSRAYLSNPLSGGQPMPSAVPLAMGQQQDTSNSVHRNAFGSSQPMQQQLLLPRGLLPSLREGPPHQYSLEKDIPATTGGTGSSIRGSGSCSSSVKKEGVLLPVYSISDQLAQAVPTTKIPSSSAAHFPLTDLEMLLAHLSAARVPTALERPTCPTSLHLPVPSMHPPQQPPRQMGTYHANPVGMAGSFSRGPAFLQMNQELRFEGSNALAVYEAPAVQNNGS
ncbi:hypothetical protein CLOM_g13548 [Closterium sp. NIES-68]|nr:hypothetical protein CLOM_g13548 [Closterium sp. NIES-68]GJP68302.1 hypothetical protein CLOP_g25030 [Closterium sp. NIES-67]